MGGKRAQDLQKIPRSGSRKTQLESRQCAVAAHLAVLSILYRALRRLVGFVLTGEALRLRKIEQNTTAVCQYSEYLTLLNSFPDVKKSDEGASHEY
jgi:CHASE3 domain sensor protein